MRLVDDQRLVLVQPPVILYFGQQYAVRHELDVAVRIRGVGKTDLVAYGFAGARVQFFRDPVADRTRREPPRLRMPDLAPVCESELDTDLGQLRGFAGAGLAADDNDLVLADHAPEVIAPGIERQIAVE